ncbi:MAG TPA: 4Fe-4S dicluster domain-containing protein [Atribacteraceae bacterium]|nr:4Fe-4S dicluster domain-containing protein [Atribacteraceae bacterium]
MKKVRIHEEFCIGCRLCEINCLVKHSHSGKIIKAFKEEFPRALPRIRLEEEGVFSFALQCRHCDDAPCVENCLTGAMRRERDGQTVLCDEEICVGCWMCIMSCPYGVIQMERKARKVASKCDLCGKDEIPRCVANCPNEALTYE